jgi:hypothetical protein
MASSIRHDTVTKHREDERHPDLPSIADGSADGWQNAFY